jgi:carboxyl-terminal processing protease
MQDLNQPEDNARKGLLMPLCFSFVLVAGIAAGYFLSSNSSITGIESKVKGGGNTKISSLLEYIKMDYVDTINEKQLVEKTVTSMLQSLDPHSAYIPAEDFAQVNESLEGNFEGIGVEFNIINDTIRVITPISGGPSDKLGIKSGDKIVKVNGKNVAGIKITSKQVFEKLRGEEGSKVLVSVLRSGAGKLIDFNITRSEIPLYSIDISYIVKPGIGYIKISRFAATTYEEYLNAFNSLTKKGMKKLILDLRGNPGGFLRAAVDLADEFLMDGLQIVYTEGRSNPKKVYRSTSRGSFESNDLVILIDEGSASASEIVAGAVQDNDRATIIGRRSFGKGLVQDQKNLPDGSAVRLTVARYYTPTGRCIQKPYEHGTEEYYKEELERYNDGEMLNADSNKLDKSKKFITPGGKTVYGGGGIMPDIFVPLDTNKYSSFENKLFYNGVVTEFGFIFSDKHRAEFLKKYSADKFVKEYIPGDELLNEFYALVQKKKLEIPEGERTRDNTALKQLIKAIVGRNLYDKDAYYPIINQTDNSIKKAVELLDTKN